MTGYAPFLIAPFQTGLDSDRESWLLPQDAFTAIENGHIHHGYVEKRSGTRFLGDMVHASTISAATAANPAVFTSTTVTLLDGDTVSLHDLAGGTWSTLNDASYTVTGVAGSDFSLIDSSGTTVDGSGLGTYTISSGRVWNFPGLRIMGIFRYISASNVRQTLISDTERIALYNPNSEVFEPLDLFDSTSTLRPDSDVWASTDTDYIWSANWQSTGVVNRVYITNGKAFTGATPGTDGIVYYDATSARVNQFQPSLGGTNVLYGSKLIFVMKQRLVVLHTFEYNGSSTSTHPQRARWCAAQAPSNWNDVVAGGGGFVDAPTGDQIVSARALQDMIIVQFTDSVWRLRVIPDPSLPFRWEKINDFRACDGRMASVGFDRYVIAAGQRGITATDGVETRRIDDRIENFVSDQVNDDEFDKVFAARSYENTRTWLLFPKGTDADCQSALVYDDESQAFSEYKFTREVSSAVVDMNVLGYGAAPIDYAAQDFVAANDLDVDSQGVGDATALSFFWSLNAELFLGGDRAGAIYVMETGGTDAGSPISFSMTSAGWNPFVKEGMEAQLGYIDFYFDSDQRTTLSIEFNKNDSETPYASQGMDLLPNLNFKALVAQVTPNSDPTTGFSITANTHGVAAGEQFYMYGIDGSEFYNDTAWEADSVTEDTISVAADISGLGEVITGISQANPGVVTATAHDFVDGDIVYLTDVSGMTEVNGVTYTVANATTNTFELSGIDTTGFTAYTSGGFAFYAYTGGGQIVERKFYRTKVWKRAYAGGVGYVHTMSISSQGKNRSLRIHAFKPWFRPRGRRTLG